MERFVGYCPNASGITLEPLKSPWSLKIARIFTMKIVLNEAIAAKSFQKLPFSGGLLIRCVLVGPFC